MKSSAAETSLRRSVSQFERAIRTLAIELAEEVIRREFGVHARGTSKSSSRAVRAPSKRAVVVPERPQQGVSFSSPAPGPNAGKARWTRERIVNELAGMLVGGTAIDAAFVNRHGPRGLVNAARKTFGRFDAALNVASLRVSQLYPDGPPRRRGS